VADRFATRADFSDTTTAGNCIAGWQQKESVIARDMAIFHSYPVIESLSDLHSSFFSFYPLYTRARLPVADRFVTRADFH
jgi:hypothetical protein